MRFMVITKATPESEAGILPATEDFDTMGAFIEELVDAGVLLAAEGLHSSAHGARIYLDGADTTVVDGPFTESKELIGGFWLVQMNSLEECVEWFKRCPVPRPGDGSATISRSGGFSTRPTSGRTSRWSSRRPWRSVAPGAPRRSAGRRPDRARGIRECVAPGGAVG